MYFARLLDSSVLIASLLVTVLAVAPPSLAFAGVAIAKTPMIAVVDHFGAASRFNTGDAGDSEDKVCYLIDAGKTAYRVYFIVGELGGGTEITHVRVVPTARSAGPCVAPQRAEADLLAAINEYADEGLTKGRLSTAGFTQNGSNEWTRCGVVEIHADSFNDCTVVSSRYDRGVLAQLDLFVSITD